MDKDGKSSSLPPLNTSRDTRATARVARLRLAVWPRLRRVSRLGCVWH